MNREIKFRAWDLLNKKMLQYSDIMALPMWEVLPGTPEQRPYQVMQYTGLKDKNGKEIYEGDILSDGDEWAGFVGYREGGYYLEIGKIYSPWLTVLTVVGKVDDYSIIGNIYENPTEV